MKKTLLYALFCTMGLAATSCGDDATPEPTLNPADTLGRISYDITLGKKAPQTGNFLSIKNGIAYKAADSTSFVENKVNLCFDTDGYGFPYFVSLDSRFNNNTATYFNLSKLTAKQFNNVSTNYLRKLKPSQDKHQTLLSSGNGSFVLEVVSVSGTDTTKALVQVLMVFGAIQFGDTTNAGKAILKIKTY
ncbi:hypothetical protein SAMN05421780_105206 [Flexibacter flexilis DSM 6793]|uniref:Uncharacterized protein n=1 Tax=Flexibacter flexilis DSM 6793 TaxID=927664 RepID=A0A1I1J4S4_9BACT|nr:hypothetical protein [Flexibacter flexilis]SFC43524.1 hypothetical protein SAMN05421780_105206 [Flexibacter flexilis DSM 6793]